MTEELKEILIAKMLDTPASLSDDELDSILHDRELREIYEISAAVSDACMSQQTINAKEEWERFRPRIVRKPRAMQWVMRVAAIFLGVMVIAGIVVKLIDYVFTPETAPVIADAEKNAEPEILIPIISDPPAQRCERPAVVTAIHNQEAASSTEEIDIDEYLLIQQARIDNEIALMDAATYEDEFFEILSQLDLNEDDYALIYTELNNVTLQ